MIRTSAEKKVSWHLRGVCWLGLCDSLDVSSQASAGLQRSGKTKTVGQRRSSSDVHPSNDLKLVKRRLLLQLWGYMYS